MLIVRRVARDTHRPSLRCDELEVVLIYSMSVSVDGFIADREGAFGWTAPSDELFRFHLAQVRELGGYILGRRLYETMLVWETDSSLRDNEARAAFADLWRAIPKIVVSRTLDSVQGNARLAETSVAEEAAAALNATDKGVSIGGAGLAASAIQLGLVDELQLRLLTQNPTVKRRSRGTPACRRSTHAAARVQRCRSAPRSVVCSAGRLRIWLAPAQSRGEIGVADGGRG